VKLQIIDLSEKINESRSGRLRNSLVPTEEPLKYSRCFENSRRRNPQLEVEYFNKMEKPIIIDQKLNITVVACLFIKKIRG